MSVQAFLDHQRRVRDLIAATPACWAVVANSVHAQAEHEEIVAVFDTQAQAEAYVEASFLPDDWNYARRNILQRQRAFRPDSRLWEYNKARSVHAVNFAPAGRFEIVVEMKNPLVHVVENGVVNGIPINPPPPSGPMPDEVFAADVARRLGG